METANIITINTEDKNLAEVIKKIVAEAGLTIADLFDDDEVRDHIHESGIPLEEIYDEDEILDQNCVTDKIQELEDQISDLEEKNDELDTKNAKLKKKNAKLAEEVLTEEQKEDMQGQAYKDGWKDGWAGVDVYDGRYGTREERIEELERQLAQLRNQTDE